MKRLILLMLLVGCNRTYNKTLMRDVVCDFGRARIYNTGEPVIIFHHGRGLNYDDYDCLLSSLNGTVISIDDGNIFETETPEHGMLNASYIIEQAAYQFHASYLIGHSRGGGAVQYCQYRNVAYGYGYLMAYDVLSSKLPPAKTLVVAATLDANLGFEMTSGHYKYPFTFDVINGGNHDFISNDVTDGPATITRFDEQVQCSNFINEWLRP